LVSDRTRLNAITRCAGTRPERLNADPRQHHFTQGRYPALHGAEAGVGLPERLQLGLQIEVLGDVSQEAILPLLDGEVSADAGEIDDGDGDALGAQARRRADHEGRLAHLAGGEDVAELAAAEAFV